MKLLFKSFIFSLFSLFLTASWSIASASEQIDLFASKLEVNQDLSLSIDETITYSTTEEKHGIYRYLPYIYNHDGYKKVLPIKDFKVSVDDQLVKFDIKKDDQFLLIKIGDPNTTFTGTKKYHLSYRVVNAVEVVNNQVGLLWDVTGEGWQVPIVNSRAEISSQFAQIENADCIVGAVGSQETNCILTIADDHQKALMSSTKVIEYGDNFTFLLQLSKNNQLNIPSKLAIFIDWLKYNWSLLLLPLPLLLMLVWWFKQGRDIQFISSNIFNLDETRPTKYRAWLSKAREPMVYAPLKDLTPGEAGALVDEKVDIQDVVAEILELARKKYLKIVVKEEKKFFSTKRKYEFIKLKNDSSKLPKVQSYLLKKIFKKKKNVSLDDLKGSFYTSVAKAKTMLEEQLMNKKVYRAKPSKDKVTGVTAFFVLSIAVAFIIFKTYLPINIIWPIFVLLVQVPFGVMLASNLAQKTAVGTNLWLQARGLRKTIKYGKWRVKINEKKLFIENILPFAVSLGVVQQLYKDMKELEIEVPKYFDAYGLSSLNSLNMIDNFSKEIASDISYNPSSSSSSSFSGGGFSSGSGGGGGGGGSW